MNARAEVNDIATIIETNPVSVLIDDNLYSRLRDHVEAEINAFVPDLSTATGRKEIGSLAYKVTRTKTAIDNAGKKLNEDARAQINKVDAKRRIVREEFEALAERARKPLTDWETEEEARIERCMTVLKAIVDCGNGLIGGAPQPFAALLHELEQVIVIDDRLGEFEEQARTAHRFATDKLNAAFEVHKKAEADRIELEQLRAEKERRDRIEAERLKAEQLAAEQAQRERDDAARAEREAQEQKVREEQIAEAARQKVIMEAQAEQRRKDAEAAAWRAEQEEKIARLEAEKKAAAEKAEREEASRLAEIEKTRREEEARAADRKHRGEVMGAAKDAFMAVGVREELAKKIVLAIVAGEIPNVTLRF
ncbi:hypothetical protein EN781_00355 [Mesorhizobium sp. M4A.F.Ca.ET.090.04.2.1]|uniref:hypothetical protein n=1 Tax=Mesorhizobium sp. M4A.F.Ca.ET.090.04.2.1 TaxID=2496663 RepID=UPI000FCB008D|nr:hypothetical protein [Mesorhizobium sp. M4A.F.Ca.ET.090.04.2.1]RVC47622.1 hypothetical protein EN781_00355 [Mesorhizobium sp. M4A.F.Ca.ET.090.04.2.1]